MALRQSSERRVILGAGCRRTGDIKERDRSIKMNPELLMPVLLLGAQREQICLLSSMWGGDACVTCSQIGEWNGGS